MAESVTCRGGTNGVTARASKAGRHPMDEIKKFKICNQMIFPILRLITHAA